MYNLSIREELKKKPFFCPFPFQHIYSETDGTFKLCVEAGRTDYNIENSTIQEWYTSDHMNKIRKEMLSNNPNWESLNDCFQCIASEKHTNSSSRTRLIKDLPYPVLEMASYFKNTGEYWFLERTLNIQMRMYKNADTCNLGCYMCFPRFSTIRQRDIKQTNATDLIPHYQYEKEEELEFKMPLIDQFIELMPYIQQIEIIGGEPLYVKECFDFIEKLVKAAPEECAEVNLFVFTNLSHLKLKNRDFLQYAKHFNQVEFKVSMDGVGKYNEYIRRNSNYDELYKNIQTLKKENYKILVWPTISLLTVLRYKELENMLIKNDLRHQFNIVVDPDILHIRHLPNPIKEKLLIELSDKKDIVNALKAERDEQKFQDAMAYIKRLDEKYNTNVFDLYPELEEFTK